MPMIYRNLIGQNHCSSGLIGMSDAGSGKQVKESKSSERKNTQMSLIFHLIFLCSVLLFYSCNNHEKYDFESMPLHTEYELTKKGKSLMPILKDLNQWGKEWL